MILHPEDFAEIEKIVERVINEKLASVKEPKEPEKKNKK